MGKKTHKDKGENPKGSQPSNQTKTNTNNTATKPNPKIAQARGEYKVPKVAPLVPAGTMSHQKQTTSTYPLTQVPPTNAKDHVFAVPRVEKRMRDPSLSSRGSEKSSIPPPTKTPKTTYAAAATPKPSDRPSMDTNWPDYQLRIYRGSTYHEALTYQEFADIRLELNRHSFTYLQNNPDNDDCLQLTSSYYNKVLRCGVINCGQAQALAWFQRAITEICGENYRGWTKTEQVTTFVKIFIPLGFENLTTQEYLEANRLMMRGSSARGIPWNLMNEYIHQARQNRVAIAAIPTETFAYIQSRGVETKPRSGVWKIAGFLAPLKLTVAAKSDLRSAKPASSPNNQIPEKESPTQTSSTPSTPPPTLTQSPPPTITTTPEENILTANDPYLSSMLMSPLNEAMEKAHVSEAVGESAMDFALLDSPSHSPNQSDTDDFGDSWADQDQEQN